MTTPADLRGYYDQSYFPGMGGTTPPPVPAAGATAGTPGTWTPAGSTPPATVAALIAGTPNAVVASPTTAWTVGQHVLTGDAAQANWNGTAWEAGAAVLVEDPAGGDAAPNTTPAVEGGTHKKRGTR